MNRKTTLQSNKIFSLADIDYGNVLFFSTLPLSNSPKSES